MSEIGKAAVKAVSLVKTGICKNPVDAWDKAISEANIKETTKGKGCAEETFLGLCEDEYVVGITSGTYTTSKENKEYGITAVKLIKEDESLIKNAVNLWRLVLQNLGKSGVEPNSQMAVVISLWNEKLLK